jgi:hypothetical protein
MTLQEQELLNLMAGLLTPLQGNISPQCKSDGQDYVNQLNQVKLEHLTFDNIQSDILNKVKTLAIFTSGVNFRSEKILYFLYFLSSS